MHKMWDTHNDCLPDRLPPADAIAKYEKLVLERSREVGSVALRRLFIEDACLF